MNRQDFRFSHRLRVRWAEVDMQKIVFNAHYLMYFDTAMAEYWRALAVPYEETMQSLGGDLYLKKAGVEFHASARFDDTLDVAMKCSRIGTSSVVFDGAIFRGGEKLASGELIYVFADPETQKSKPVPDVLRQLMNAYESGESVVSVKTGSWAQLGQDAAPLRHAVFVLEQGIEFNIERDGIDGDGVHSVAYNRLGKAVATGRLVPLEGGHAKLGRMAVHRVLRGSRLGRDILHALVDAARARGDREITLHAQQSAEGFYRGLGFAQRGEPFDEAGIPHLEMFRAL
jgi:YbgC/YbaW family acyl-CoA thioester hydrolase